MSDTQWETPNTDIPRDRYSRPLVTPPDGSKPIPYTRCTTYVSCLEDTYNLAKWQKRMVAVGLAARPDLLLRASSLGADPGPTDEAAKKRWKKEMDATCDAASEAAASSASATVGTALHSLTERIDRGLDIGTIPDTYKPHLKAYEQATRNLQAVHIERFCVQDQLKVGGTPDRIVTIDGLPGLYIADVKTGAIDFGVGKMAMQLAVYAHSHLYNHQTGTRTPLADVNTDRGIIIALNAATGTCELKWIDIAKGWQAVELATQVRDWRAANNLMRPFDIPAAQLPMDPTPAQDQARDLTAEAQAALTVAIHKATSEDELIQLWTAAGTAWQPHHTEMVKARKAELATQTAA
jgi:hypothetical protein